MAKKFVTHAFFNSLAIISILGFLSIIASVWFGLDFITENLSAIILIVLGAGLIVEGQVRRWRKLARGGLDSNELAHIITGIVGILALVVGLLDLAGFTGTSLNSTKGIIAVIAIVIIAIETWVVD